MRPLNTHTLNKYRNLIFWMILTVLIWSIGPIVLGKYMRYKYQKLLLKEHEALPLYLRVSASTERLLEEKQREYINVVKRRYGAGKNAPTCEDVVSQLFPNIPQKYRRWECYKYKGKIYVCYVIRPYWIKYCAFIWRVVPFENPKTYSVLPANGEAKVIELGLSYNKRPSKDDELYTQDIDKILKSCKTQREKDVVLFCIDRFSISEPLEELSYEIAEKKFGLSRREILHILNGKGTFERVKR